MKASAISKLKPFVFLREVRTELSKVVWPSKQKATRLTVIIVLVSSAVAVFLGAFDLLFTRFMEFMINQ